MKDKTGIAKNKIVELFDMLSQGEKFWSSIKEFRKQFKIPENGFNMEKDAIKWLDEKDKLEFDSEYELMYGPTDFIKRDKTKNSRPKELKKYLDALNKILKQYKIPLSGRWILVNYIVSNNKVKYYAEDTQEFRWYLPSDEDFSKFGEPFIKLAIYNSATLEDLIRYLKKEWKDIKEGLKGFGAVFDRVRRRSNKVRDEWIIREYYKSRKELGIKKYQSKDLFISTKANEIFVGGINPDTVRSIIARHKKRLRDI